MDQANWTDPICGDPACYRGRIAGWNYQFKDGPCNRSQCEWPWQYMADDPGYGVDGALKVWVTCTPDVAAVAMMSGVRTRRYPARPHFTDTPATPIVDAGKAALAELRRKG